MANHKDVEEYVPYGLALELKELKFDYPCNHCYMQTDTPTGVLMFTGMYAPYSVECSSVLSAPSFNLVAQWLREVKGIAINVIAHDGGQYKWEIIILPHASEEYDLSQLDRSPWYHTYEDALREAIEIVIEKILS